MFKLILLCLCVCSVVGAPSKDRTYGHIARETVQVDTFRPRFPGVVLRKDTSDDDDVLLFKMVDPSASLPGSGVTRDIIEKPVVEKTIIKECNCDKHIEEKHLDEPYFELATTEITPAESQYQGSVIPANSNSEEKKLEKDLYDVPINPDFGFAPSDDPDDNSSKKDLYDGPVNHDFGPPASDDSEDNSSEKNLYDVPINPEFGHPPSDDSQIVKENINSEKVDFPFNVGATDPDHVANKNNSNSEPETPKSEQERPNYKPNLPDVPETDVLLAPEQGSDLPLSSEHPVQSDKIPEINKSLNDKKEPILPAQDDDTGKIIIMTNEPKETIKNFEAQYPKAPVSLPDDRKEPETDSYPQHPVDGPKIPIEAVPLGPKTEEPSVKDKVLDVSTDTESVLQTENDPHNIPTKVDVDRKPVVVEAVDAVTEFPVISAESPSHPGKKPLPSTPTISAVCEDMGLRKFVYLLNKAGYKDMLTRKRPLTIFVPSDEAWNHLPLHVLNRLQRDRRFLRRVLRYHMVDGLESGQARKDYYCPSMQQGAGLFLNTYGKNMYVNGVPALPSSVKPANGAVYVLSRVMYPLPANNLAAAIQTTGTFTRFYTLAAEAGILDGELSGKGPYTLFAPTDEAFSKLPLKTIEWLSWDKEALKELLLKHLVSGTHYSTFVPEIESGHLTSLNGEDIEFKQADEKGEFSVNGAHLCAHDLTAKNGVLHAVDEVLFSKELKPRPFVRPPLKSIYG